MDVSFNAHNGGGMNAERKRIAQVCRDAGLEVESSDVRPEPGGDGFTIDGMPWEQWLEAMTAD